MLSRITLALVTVLVLASAPMTPASARNSAAWTDSGSAGFVPGSAAEKAWFDRNTRSGGGF
jgi:hypothetical protein